MKTCLTFTFASEAAASPLFEFNAIKGFHLLAASYCAQSFTGTPTNSIATILDDTVSIMTVTHATASTPATTTTTGLGGSTALPAHVDAGSIVAINITFTAGSSPTAVDAVVMLWVDLDE